MSYSANKAQQLINHLQARLTSGLQAVSGETFQRAVWQRSGGQCGGGNRYFSTNNDTFNRASVNVSHVHYESDPLKKLSSATALSTIIHPRNPHAPSIHIHLSWTEMKPSNNGYWRIMADLNPAITKSDDTMSFLSAMEHAAPDTFEEATAQGERYFFIPALKRHRGVAHFYLEQFTTGNTDGDIKQAEQFGKAVIDHYLEILRTRKEEPVTAEDTAAQLSYHSLYFLQVLTLDRGTTSGLLVHDENDLGIMGSLPAYVDKDLLVSWRNKLPAPQDELLDSLLSCLPSSGEVTDEARLKLAQAVRQHYQAYPHALTLQASGYVIPPTVANHK